VPKKLEALFARTYRGSCETWANLPTKIQAFPSYCMDYLHLVANNLQKNLCGIVRLCGNCAATISRLNVCGICAGGFPLAVTNRGPLGRSSTVRLSAEMAWVCAGMFERLISNPFHDMEACV